jgi:hypothetical protein
MKLRPDGFPGVVGAGAAGAAWGLGLARLVAEIGLCAPLFCSPLLVAVVSSICAVLTAVLWRWRQRRRFSEHSPLSGYQVPLSAAFIPLFFPLLYVAGVIPDPLAGCVLLIGGAVLAVLIPWADQVVWPPLVVLGLTVLGLYLRTLLSSVGRADTFEFQVVVPLLRVAHPTGYPLYVLLGKLFTLLPVGNVAWRVNLASAAFATATVLVTYVLTLRLIVLLRSYDPAPWDPGQQGGSLSLPRPVWWLPAFLAALALAFSATFWSQAVIAEVYALHNLLVVIILWFLLLPTVPVNRDQRASVARRWQMVFLLIGLSLTNHLTTVLLIPSVALLLLWERPRLRLRDWLIAAGLFLCGLSVYLFIPLRWPALNGGQAMTVQGFVSYITGGQFHGALQLDGWRDPVRWGIVGRMLVEPFGWVGLGLAALGVVGLARRHRQVLVVTGVTWWAYVFYGLTYYVPDISVFLLPAHLILTIWIGVGFDRLANLASSILSSVLRNRSSSAVYSLLIILFALLPLSRIWLNLPAVDQSGNHGGYQWGQYVLGLPLAAQGAVLADIEKFAPLYYLQQIEGLRPDLDLVLLGSEELYYEELAARLAAEQTVYLARYLPSLGGLQLHSLGPVVEVGDSTSIDRQLPSGEIEVDFGDRIQLLSAKLDADPLQRPLYHLTLYWRARAHVDADLTVRLRLVDSSGVVRWESAGARPVSGLYPTNAWPVGVVISDYHEVTPPSWLPPGKHVLEVGLFPRFDGSGLRVNGGQTEWLALDILAIEAPPGPLHPLSNQVRNNFGRAWLTGYNLPTEVPAGAPFAVDLSWSGVDRDSRVSLAWVDQEGQKGEAFGFSLFPGMGRSHHVIAAPISLGDYQLRVSVEGEAARCGWLAATTRDCALAVVKVSPAQEGLANFADLVRLVDAQVGQSAALPGEVIPVALQWRALRAMDEDYTVFVQLIGPDGRPHGQVDMWPVQGTHPTSQWTPGEELKDPYEVRLDPDAPAGNYRVEVGWYLLATMQRLQILGAAGHTIGDSFVVGEFSVGE